MVIISIDTSLLVAMIQMDYDKQREQLQNVTFEIAGQTAIDNKYQYDAVDNDTTKERATSIIVMSKITLGN